MHGTKPRVCQPAGWNIEVAPGTPITELAAQSTAALTSQGFTASRHPGHTAEAGRPW